MRRFLNLVVLALAALAAAACTLTQLAYSNIGLAYNNAPPVLAWMVSDYVEMSDEQKDFVRDRMTSAFAWHRARELPEYRRFLEKVLAQAEDNITVEEAAVDYREMREHYHRAIERLLPDMAEFLVRLDSLQAKQMERRFAKDNKKVATDTNETPGEDRQEKRVERLVTHLEQFTGSLSDAQRSMVAGFVAAQPEFTEERLADRRYRQDAILQLVKSKPSREEATAELRRLFVDTESWRSPDYRRKLRQRDTAFFGLIARLSASLSPEQRTAFRNRVRGFMRDITEITASRAANAG
jgi:hypothetical protein